MKTSAYFIQGPTGVGKNALALEVCNSSGAQLINVDSVQIYQKLIIGANSPTEAEKQICPHYFFNFLDPSEKLTAGQYMKLLKKHLQDVQQQQRLCFVGGSGFYFQALEKGMPDLKPIEEHIKKQIQSLDEELENDQLWEHLRSLSSDAAKTLHPNDRYRILRALTLILSQNKDPKQLEAEILPVEAPLHNYKIKKVALYLERAELKQHLQGRIVSMFHKGLLAEAQALVDSYGEACPALRSIGYKELVPLLKKQTSINECQHQILKNTLLLAKKQMTWLRRDSDIHWFHAFEERQQAKDFLLST